MIRFIFGQLGYMGKLIFIMGLGTVLFVKPPFIDTDSRFEVIRSEDYVYQVNYEKDKIDSVEIFDRSGNFKGEYEYSELKGTHKNIIDKTK